MYFYNLTLKQASAITHAVVGQFSGKREDFKKGIFELAVVKGKYLEILKPDEHTGRIKSLISVNVFGIIRSIAAFRLTGGIKDYLIIGSESGRVVILEYLPEKRKFDKIHQETFGRSGIRRIIPGQYLACDTKGRAFMIGAIEKQKLVYQLNRDNLANLTISSPLEAHKANTIVFHMINVDVGYENPLFACLEVDYEDADEDPTGKALRNTKQALTYYELDLGLNHVVRKYSEPLDDFANFLIPVPGGNDGPSGLIVCSKNFITYKNFGEQQDIRCPIPRRKGETDVKDRGILIASSATCKYIENDKTKFFFLIQTELGDIFKTDFIIDDDIVLEIIMVYFDTLTVASSLCVLPNSKYQVEGSLFFVAAEFGNHQLYQIKQVDDREERMFSSKSYEVQMKNRTKKIGQQDDDDEYQKLFQFRQRDSINNLDLIDEIESMAPILSAQTANLLDEHKLIVSCAARKHSSLRILRHGLKVTERAHSSLPSIATGLWSIKERSDSLYHDYIVVSFTNATLVLRVGDNIEEIVDSGFLGTKATIGCVQLGDDSLIQVHADGIRHIYADNRVSEWRTPFKRQIVRCALNRMQVAIALSNNEIIYFEMNSKDQLDEYNERKSFSGPIGCMALGDVPAREKKSRFLAVGLDQKVCIISLSTSECMMEITRQTFTSNPESICIAELGGGQDLNYVAQLYLTVGLQSGEIVKTRLDGVTGDLSEPNIQYLGAKPVKLFNVKIQDKHSLLACTSKTWLAYYHQCRYHLSPLSCEPFDYATSFNSPQVSDGFIAISGNDLKVLTIEHLGDVYNQESFPLEASPRRCLVLPGSGNVVVMMTDRLPLLITTTSDDGNRKNRKVVLNRNDHDADDDGDYKDLDNMGAIIQKGDKWRSLIKLIDPQTGQVFSEISFESNQAALCMAMATFGSSDSVTIHVGIAVDYKLKNQTSSGNEIYTYNLSPKGDELKFLHKTSCEQIPRAMCAFQQRLAVGMGQVVRIYDLGKQKLLRKCESKQIQNCIATISSASDRLFVSDVSESFTFMKYRLNENVLSVFADDLMPRYIVSSAALNYNTVIGGDKFGNISVLQLPEDINDDLDDDPTGTKSLWDRGWLGGSSQKVESIATTHIGEIVTSIHKTCLTLGRSECIIYTTIHGSIGALIELDSKEDFEFFQTLEMHLRQEQPPLCGRDHLAFTSSYFPIKNIIDGDLCERYLTLDARVQERIVDEMEQQFGFITSQIDSMIERII